jgi:signal transduction histidine kinase
LCFEPAQQPRGAIGARQPDLGRADREAAAAALEAIERTGRDALADLRRLLSILQPAPLTSKDRLAPQRGIDDLESLAARMRSAGLEVTVQFEGERSQISAALTLSIYRIAQEALTNTLKHAAAKRAAVVVRFGDDAVEVECTDDGAGVSAQPNGAGHGLVGMRERARVLGGELEAGPGTDGGYCVRARLPWYVHS